jgi:hypothetical protein
MNMDGMLSLERALPRLSLEFDRLIPSNEISVSSMLSVV